jgi:hypothetical protein
VQRDTSKHGPRLDDALAHEARSLVQGAPVEAHAEEWREHEPSGEDDPEISSRTHEPGSLGVDAVAARRELSRHLRLRAFPADRQGLLAEAEEQQAPRPVVAALRLLPDGVRYGTVHEVWAALEGYEDVREAAAHEPLADADG